MNLPSIDKGTEWILLAILSPGLRIISPFSDRADRGHPRHFTEASHLSKDILLVLAGQPKFKTLSWQLNTYNFCISYGANKSGVLFLMPWLINWLGTFYHNIEKEL